MSCVYCKVASTDVMCSSCKQPICGECFPLHCYDTHGITEPIGDEVTDYYRKLNKPFQQKLDEYVGKSPWDLLKDTKNDNILGELSGAPYFWIAMAQRQFDFNLVANWPDKTANVLQEQCAEWRMRYVAVAIKWEVDTKGNAVMQLKRNRILELLPGYYALNFLKKTATNAQNTAK